MPRQTIQDLQSLAFHLADCHAATAERFGSLKSTSAYNKERLGLICEDTASLLRLLTKPPYTPRDLSVFERLDEAAKTLKPPTPAASPDDEIYDIGAALDPRQAHDAEEEAKKNRK
jgi:hypothetical protein